ncbi:hypothetical protein MKW94_023174, partial [Papaver nudicaule]|nr:hypothetical protein [Papaver nudicaule]
SYKGKEGEDVLLNTMGKLAIDETTTFKKPVIIIVVKMAVSGKTTFMNQLVYHTRGSGIRGYVVSLDPAVMTLPYGANIDIRDTVKYKEVMKQYNLGPNGEILTSLNLFATKFDEVVSVIEKRAEQLDYVLVDISGFIITEAFASTFPTVIADLVDTPRSSTPVTFMSTMLYACSIFLQDKIFALGVSFPTGKIMDSCCLAYLPIFCLSQSQLVSWYCSYVHMHQRLCFIEKTMSTRLKERQIDS